ncbi:TPA: hypothetical protein ACH3X2_007345 [Trebouxia sp. C0005]
MPLQPWQQQRQSGGNRWNRCNERQNAGEQQHDGVHADSPPTMHTDNASLAKNMSAQQTASSNMQHHMQAAVGFRPQYGPGGVNRAPPGLQQGSNKHWWRSDMGSLRLPPGLRHQASGQQQGSVGASPKLPPGLPVGTNSPAARQHDNHHEMERSRGAKPSSCFDRIRSDGVRPKARVGSDPAAKSRADGRILEDVRLTAKN